MAQGLEFLLPYNFPPDANHQRQWRFCDQCHGMFYDGFPSFKGICPAGGVHVAQGWEFSLPFGLNPKPTWSQEGWHYCRLCAILFFYGRRLGPCPGGGWLGSHDLRGSINFMLPHYP